MAWAVLCLAALAVAATTVRSFECPVLRTSSLIPDPDDCRKYYHCLPDGRVFPMQCPNDLVFDPNQKVCIWDSNARSCAPDYQLEPIKRWKPDDVSKADNNDNSNKNSLNNNDSRRKKTQKQKKNPAPNRNRNRNQNNKRKPVQPKRQRNDRSRRTTQKRIVPTTTTTTTPRPTTTTTTTTTTMPPATTVEVMGTNGDGGVQKTVPEGVNVIGNILATLGFDLDSNSDNDQASEVSENVETAPVTDRFYDSIAGGHRRADDRTQQRNDRLTSQISHQGRQAHSVQKRSPEDNMIWDSVRCPSSYAYMPDPSNCNVFYHCYNWQPMRKLCPPGLFFDHRTYVCNWPHNVDCFEGYRTKSLYSFNERRRMSKDKVNPRTTTPPKKTTKKSWRWSQRRTTTTTTTTTAPTTTRMRRMRFPFTTPVFSPSPQQFRNKISFKYSDAPLESTPATDVMEDMMTSSDSIIPSSSVNPTLIPDSSSVPILPSSNTSIPALPSSNTTIPTLPTQKLQHPRQDIKSVFSLKPQPTEHSQKQKPTTRNIFSPKPTGETEQIFNSKLRPTTRSQNLFGTRTTGNAQRVKSLRQRPTGPLYDFNPARKTVQSQFSFNKATQRTTTDLPSDTTRWRSSDTFSWMVTSDLPLSFKNRVEHEPYASDVKTGLSKDSQEEKEKTSSATTTAPTASTTKAAGTEETTLGADSATTAASPSSDSTSSAVTTGKETAGTTVAVDAFKRSNISAVINATNSPSGSTGSSSTQLNKTEFSSSTSTAETPVGEASTTGTTTAAPASTSQAADSAKNTSSLPSSTTKTSTTAATKKGESSATTTAGTTTASTTKAAQTTPVAFAAARIPFYAMRNQRVGPASWLNQGRQPVSSSAFRRGSRLRARTQNTQGRTMNASPFKRPTMATGSFGYPSSNRRLRSGHPDSPEDVQIEKFMIKLLNDAMKSKHVVSRDVGDERRRGGIQKDGAARVTITYDQTTHRLKGKTAGTGDSDADVTAATQKNTPPTLYLEVNTKDLTTTNENVQDTGVDGKVITSMAASISGPGDVTKADDDIFQTEELIVNEAQASSFSFSATKPAEDARENLIMVELETDEVFDKQLLQDQDKKKGGKAEEKALDLTEELDYSGDAEGEWAIPKIQAFSALAGHELVKGDDDSKAEDTAAAPDAKPLNQEKESEKKEVTPAAADDPLPETQKKEEGEKSGDPTKEPSQDSDTATQASTTTKSKDDAGKASTESPPVKQSSADSTATTTTTTNTTTTATTTSSNKTTTKQQTQGCNDTSCSTSTAPATETSTKANATQTTSKTTTNDPDSHTTTTAAPTTTSTAAGTETSTLKVEAYAAKDALLKDFEAESNDNRIDVEIKEDNKIVADDSKVLKDNEMRNELDGVAPKSKKNAVNKVQEQIIPESEPALPKKVTKESIAATSSTTETSSLSAQTESVTKASEDETASPLNATKATQSGDEDSSQAEDASPKPADTKQTTESETSPKSTTAAKNTSVADETASPTPTSSANAQADSQPQNVTATATTTENDVGTTTPSGNEKISNVTIVTSDNAKSANVTSETVTSKDVTSGGKEVNSTTAESVTEKGHSNATDTTGTTLETKTNTTTTAATSTSVASTSPSSTTTATTKQSNATNSSANSTPISPSNDSRADTAETSEPKPVAYLSDNTNVEAENTMTNTKAEKSGSDDGKQSSPVAEDSEESPTDESDEEKSSNVTSDTSAESSVSSEKASTSSPSTTTLATEGNTTVSTNVTGHATTVSSGSSDPAAANNSTSTESTTISNVTTTTTTMAPSTTVLTNASEEQHQAEEEKTKKANETESAASTQSSTVEAQTEKAQQPDTTSDTTKESLASDVTVDESTTETDVSTSGTMKNNSDVSQDFKASSKSADAYHYEESVNNDDAANENYAGNDATTGSGTTSSKRSFVSLTDLITWYLKHWRNYSKWRQDQTTLPTTVTF